MIKIAFETLRKDNNSCFLSLILGILTTKKMLECFLHILCHKFEGDKREFVVYGYME